MVDRTELQNKARLVESHRQHLEELQRRMDQIVNVINEHQVTEEVLSRLISMAETGESKVGQLAKEFNEAAEKLQASENQSPPSPPTKPSAEANKPAPKQRRRGSMFGSELTLDD